MIAAFKTGICIPAIISCDNHSLLAKSFLDLPEISRLMDNISQGVSDVIFDICLLKL